jgi:hypothetical protein
LIRVDPVKWIISSDAQSKWGRIINVARTVFDAALHETPISAYGINTHAHLVESAAEKIGRELADKFKLPRAGAKQAGQFSYRDDRDDHAITVTTQPLGGEYVVTYNVHHPIPPDVEGKMKTFSFGNHLDGNATRDWRAGIEFASAFALRHNINTEVK